MTFGCARWIAALVALAGITRGAVAGEAKNIIILVSDGGGFNAYRLASYYQHGRLGCQPYDRPEWAKYGSRTVSLNLLNGNKKDPIDPANLWDRRRESAAAASLAAGVRFKGYDLLRHDPTDSAAAGTAMATGYKVWNGRINFIPENGGEVPAMGKAISEIARSKGKATGVVTSVQWNDATPATFGGAHNAGRGSRREIANEMFNSNTLDLIMGAGHPEFDHNGAPRGGVDDDGCDIAGGSFTWGLIKSGRHSGGWTLVETKAQFERLMSGPTPNRVLGLARVSGTLQAERGTRDWNRDGKVDSADARVAPAYGDPPIRTVPTLATMTRGALNMLSRHPKGFFVMIEGGAVDKCGHANQPGRMIEEQVDFNNSVRAAVEWVERYSNWDETLVIITADHETGLMWGINSDTVPFDPLVNRGAGRTAGAWYNSGGHSNSLVPLYARGAGADRFAGRVLGTDPVVGPYVENTTIFEVMKAALGNGDNNGNGKASSQKKSEVSAEQPADDDFDMDK